jgi:3-oxoacyl-[acyl-carrier protein] reductase
MIDKPVAVITGASRGIGRAIAVKFAQEGYATALTARNETGLQETEEEIKQTGGYTPLVIPGDLQDSGQIRRLADTVTKEWGKVDVLINNAGILHLKPFLELTPDEFQEMLDVNIKAVFELTQQIVPGMIKRRSGAIVNIASLAGKNGFKNGSGYSATKFALRGFAASLMMEVREHDIRVITVFPGSVATRMMGRNPNATSRDTMLHPEDVAHAVYAAVSVDSRAMMSEIDIRPSNPKRN